MNTTDFVDHDFKRKKKISKKRIELNSTISTEVPLSPKQEDKKTSTNFYFDEIHINTLDFQNDSLFYYEVDSEDEDLFEKILDLFNY